MSETLIQPRGLGALANFENLDLTTVSTDYPVLESGINTFTIVNAKNELTKDKTGEMLVLELRLDHPSRDKHGKEVPAGYKHTHRIGLTPTFEPDPNGQPDYSKPKRTPDNIVGDVAVLLEAIYGEEGRKSILPNIGNFDMANLVNQKVTVRTAIAPEKNGYPESTKIQRFIKKEGSPPEVPHGA